MSALDSKGVESTTAEAELKKCISDSGLFDSSYYRREYGSLIQNDADPLDHYLTYGSIHRLNPNPYFDVDYYLRDYGGDIATADIDPLWHYIVVGEREGRQPSIYFSPGWYAGNRAADEITNGVLAHFLANGGGRTAAPISHFDSVYYLRTHEAARDSGLDPLEHYLREGHKRGYNPSPDFDIRYYRAQHLAGYLDVDPLRHWLTVGRERGLRRQERPPGIGTEIRYFSRPGPQFEEIDRKILDGVDRFAKLLSYYLPQFHAIEENDRWWGSGFVEWTNVARASPKYRGHYQPRIPRDLGFYDLSIPGVIEKQVALAQAMGIHGFIFYYYWFNGKRLLEKPLEYFLTHPEIEFPFAIMWANENWTRRWDGGEQDILISQDYLEEDHLALVSDWARFLTDSRYIKFGGRPVIFIYRADVIPGRRKMVETWRRLFAEKFNLQPLFIMAQTFGVENPGPFGFDGAIEFPPHKLLARVHLKPHEVLDPEFTGKVVEYEDVVNAALAEPAPLFPLIKTVMPSWDNDARRNITCTSLAGSDPLKYETWLAATIARSEIHPVFGETVVCINAWNEWAEAAYLEPDVHYGGAYLNATARALKSAAEASLAARAKVLLVGHDAFNAGAEQLLLHLARTFVSCFGIEVRICLLDGGELLKEYESEFDCVVAQPGEAFAAFARKMAGEGYRHAITNTVKAGWVVDDLKRAGFRVLSLVHELPTIIREYALHDACDRIAEFSDKVVFASRFVADSFPARKRLTATQQEIRPQGIYREVVHYPTAADEVRRELDLPRGAKLVINVGYGDLRKGFDIFMQVAAQFNEEEHVHFLWIGNLHPYLEQWIVNSKTGPRPSRNVHCLGFRANVDWYLSGSDLFFLSSREDPFPTVLLEALATGLPLLAIRGGGGFEGLFDDGKVGFLAPPDDMMEVAGIIRKAFAEDAQSTVNRNHRIAMAKSRFDFTGYAFDLAKSLGVIANAVSVIVPSYNYAAYIDARLKSIFAQSLPIRDCVVLDDASSDDSVAVARTSAEANHRRIQVIVNEKNSGNTFRQWARGLEHAKGDLVWIAECDDLSHAAFLKSVVSFFEDPDVVFAFTDSEAIDADGVGLMESYKPYYATIGGDILQKTEVVRGKLFATSCLAIKNLILNASSVVWKREALARALDASDDLFKYRLAGDWRLYLEACLIPGAKVAYRSACYNIHRRHPASVTHRMPIKAQISEIGRIHAAARRRLPEAVGLAELQAAYIEELSAMSGERAPEIRTPG